MTPSRALLRLGLRGLLHGGGDEGRGRLGGPAGEGGGGVAGHRGHGGGGTSEHRVLADEHGLARGAHRDPDAVRRRSG